MKTAPVWLPPRRFAWCHSAPLCSNRWTFSTNKCTVWNIWLSPSPSEMKAVNVDAAVSNHRGVTITWRLNSPGKRGAGAAEASGSGGRSSLPLAVQDGPPVVRPRQEASLGGADGQVLVVAGGEEDVLPRWVGLHAWRKHKQARFQFTKKWTQLSTCFRKRGLPMLDDTLPPFYWFISVIMGWRRAGLSDQRHHIMMTQSARNMSWRFFSLCEEIANKVICAAHKRQQQ